MDDLANAIQSTAMERNSASADENSRCGSHGRASCGRRPHSTHPARMEGQKKPAFRCLRHLGQRLSHLLRLQRFITQATKNSAPGLVAGMDGSASAYQ